MEAGKKKVILNCQLPFCSSFNRKDISVVLEADETKMNFFLNIIFLAEERMRDPVSRIHVVCVCVSRLNMC